MLQHSSEALQRLVDAVNSELCAHSPRLTGKCPICGHFGEDCTANELNYALDAFLEE